jgi:hypothetical protein
MRTPAAVLFDLSGTLVTGIPPSVRDCVSREMDTDLGVGPAALPGLLELPRAAAAEAGP